MLIYSVKYKIINIEKVKVINITLQTLYMILFFFVSLFHSLVKSSFFFLNILSLKYCIIKQSTRKKLKIKSKLKFKLGNNILFRIVQNDSNKNASREDNALVACQLFIALVLR